MGGKRWYQVRWNADRTDNISVPDLKAAYTYVWRLVGEPPGVPVDDNTVTIEDMVSGRLYEIDAHVLEYERDAGWEFLTRVWAMPDELAKLMKAKPSA